MAKAIMIQGTMPGVGKSLVVAGLCRILKEDGVKAAPFKAKSTETDSYVTREGLEMGRSQVIQCEASGIHPSVVMNPILIKPVQENEAQIIVNGEVVGVMDPKNAPPIEGELVSYIKEAYDLLAAQYDIIIIEGTDTPAELGQKYDVFSNMGIAKYAKAPVLLVGGENKGGIFAQLYGTVELLEEQDKKWIKGMIINKFQRPMEVMEAGIHTLERKTHKKLVGTIPYLMDMKMEEEDGIFRQVETDREETKIDIAVVRFPQVANYTDFAALERLSSIRVRYISEPEEMEYPDMIILPGTKDVIADMMWLRTTGMEEKVVNQYKQGTLIFGICGGYQMLGVSLKNAAFDANGGSLSGMGLLPVESWCEEEGEPTPVKGKLETIMGPYEKLSKAEYTGYEVPLGYSKLLEPVRTLAQKDGKLLGTCKGRVAGTYIQGFFDSREIVSAILNILADQKGIRIEEAQEESLIDHKENQYHTLASYLRESLDMKKIYEMIEKGEAYDNRV